MPSMGEILGTEITMKYSASWLGRTGRHSRIFVWLSFFIFHLALLYSGNTFADVKGELGQCAAKADKDERLGCYDLLAKRQKTEQGVTPAERTEMEEPAQISMLEKLYELTRESRENAPMVEWHNPNYFLLAAYNTTPNRNTMLDVATRATAQNTEAKFQLSGKVRPLPETN